MPQSMSSQNFYIQGNNSTMNAPPPPFVNFRPIKDTQMVNGSAPVLGYSKPYSAVETTELLYKILRGETKLVRSVLE